MQDELCGAAAKCIGDHCGSLGDLIRLTATCRAFAGSCDVPATAAITLQRWWRSQAGRRERLARACLEVYECICLHDAVPFWKSVLDAAAGHDAAFWDRYVNSAMFADPANAETFIGAKNISEIAFYAASEERWFLRIILKTAHGSDDLPRLIATAFAIDGSHQWMHPTAVPVWRRGYRSMYHAIESRVGAPGAFEQPEQWTTGFFFDDEYAEDQSPLALVLVCFTYMIREDVRHDVICSPGVRGVRGVGDARGVRTLQGRRGRRPGPPRRAPHCARVVVFF